MMRTKVAWVCAVLLLVAAMLCGCVATNGGFSIVLGEPKPHLRHGIYDLNNVECYYEDDFDPEAYAYLDEAICEATEDCKFPLNSDPRIAEYGLCIQPILVENGFFREGLLLNSATAFDGWSVIILDFLPEYVSSEYIYHGEGYYVIVSAEDGEILLIIDNWNRTLYGDT